MLTKADITRRIKHLPQLAGKRGSIHLLITLHRLSNPNGLCTLTQTQLGFRCGVSKQRVSQLLLDAAAIGLIAITNEGWSVLPLEAHVTAHQQSEPTESVDPSLLEALRKERILKTKLERYNGPGSKQCSDCLGFKPFDEFYRRPKEKAHLLSSYCKPCSNARSVKSQAKARVRYQEYHSEADRVRIELTDSLVNACGTKILV